MAKPRLLDLFCGAGGAGMGYHRAGFEVVGVDLTPQPDYPFGFYPGDALACLRGEIPPRVGYFDAIHASPPCQAYSSLGSLHPERTYPDLYAEVRSLLQASGLPWVIENVIGSPYRSGFVLCGSMFPPPLNRTRRHRNFETSHLMMPPMCRHSEQPALVGVYGASDGAHPEGHKHPGKKRGPRQVTTIEAREIMGMPWATKRHGLTQAIPPAYTEWIGQQLLAVL